MQYLIMLAIVIGLAASDFITGIIKGYITRTLNSKKMRYGGLHKICEIIIMMTAIGLEIGLTRLGHYYNASSLTDVLGNFTAAAIFAYIAIMEIISLLENYAEIDKNAAWARNIIKRLKVFNEKDNSSNAGGGGENEQPL